MIDQTRRGPAHERRILDLASALYDASNASGTRFADRGRPVQEAWLKEARRRLDEGTPECTYPVPPEA